MKKVLSVIVLICFCINMLLPGSVFAQHSPLPANFITKTSPYHPPLMKGILLDLKNPLNMDFIIDVGDIEHQKDLPSDIETLIQYFLTALTIPEDQMWVNLSPDENEAIIPDSFGQTSMGRDLLIQDYFLKQLTASLIHPDTATGKQFWEKVYSRAYQEYGTTDLPFETFNKVWISPAYANVFVNHNKAYIIDAHLKVEHETMNAESKALSLNSNEPEYSLPKEVMRSVILPVLEEEINNGETFAQLRQIYHSVILSAWFKRQIKNHILSQSYIDQEHLQGLTFASFQESSLSHEIWESYNETFKEGVYDFIREEKDSFSDLPSPELIPRQYFSGGVTTTTKDLNKALRLHSNSSQIIKPTKPPLRVRTSLGTPKTNDKTQATAKNIRDFLYHLQKDFFAESKKQGLLPKRQSSRILDVRCILASHILAQVLSHQFNLPIGGENPYRIDIVQGHYLPNMHTHFWLALYIGDENSPLFIDGSYGQFNHLWDQTIVMGSDYNETLVRRKLRDLFHSSAIEKQFLPDGSLEKAEKVSNALLKKFTDISKKDSDASELLQDKLPNPIDLFLNAVGFIKYHDSKEELIKKLEYRDEEDFLTDISTAMRNVVMSSVSSNIEVIGQNPNQARQDEAIKSIYKTLKEHPAAAKRIEIISDMYHFSSYADRDSPEGEMARLFLEKLGEFDAKLFLKHAPIKFGHHVFRWPFPIAPPRNGTPGLDGLSVLDLSSGPRGAFLMEHAEKYPLVLVDNHPFVISFLKTMAKLLQLEEKATVLQADVINNWKPIFQNRSYKHIRLANVEAYAGKLSEEFYDDLSRSVPANGTLSFELPTAARSTQNKMHSFEKYIQKSQNWVLIENKTLEGLANEPIEAWVYQKKPTDKLKDEKIKDESLGGITLQMDSVIESNTLPANKPLIKESLIHLPLKGLSPSILSIQVIADVKALLI